MIQPTPEMTRHLDLLLRPSFRARDGRAARAAVAADPDHCVLRELVARTGGADGARFGDLLASVYTTIGRKVAAGEADAGRPSRTCYAIAARAAWQQTCRAARRHNPLKPVKGAARAAGGRGAAAEWLLVARDVGSCAGRPLESEAEEAGRLAELAGLEAAFDAAAGPGPMAVFRAVREFAAARGTAHGALADVAARLRCRGGRVVVNKTGRGGRAAGPDPRAYKRVVRLYRAAVAGVAAVLAARGVAVPAALVGRAKKRRGPRRP